MKRWIVSLWFLLSWSGACAQETTTLGRLVGGWRYIETSIELGDGRWTEQFGKHPAGIFIILPNGVCSHIIMEGDLPQIKSGLIKDTSPEERERLAEGQLSWFGQCTGNPDGKSFSARIEKSSFPNFNGITQMRDIKELTDDTLRYVNTTTTGGRGARVHAYLRRVW